MRVSQRLDYVLQAMVLLATRPASEYVAAGDLALELVLPRRFVEQQVTTLAHAGIVICRRGATGGCKLARPPSEITVEEIVVAVHGSILDVPRQSASATAEMWEQASLALGEHFAGITLADLALRQGQLDAGLHSMYFI